MGGGDKKNFPLFDMICIQLTKAMGYQTHNLIVGYIK
jgi:hypothetical protein